MAVSIRSKNSRLKELARNWKLDEPKLSRANLHLLQGKPIYLDNAIQYTQCDERCIRYLKNQDSASRDGANKPVHERVEPPEATSEPLKLYTTSMKPKNLTLDELRNSNAGCWITVPRLVHLFSSPHSPQLNTCCISMEASQISLGVRPRHTQVVDCTLAVKFQTTGGGLLAAVSALLLMSVTTSQQNQLHQPASF